MYRRDMALKVLGTDDPEQVAAMLTDDAAMMDVAAKLKAEGIKMFASWQDIFNMQFSNRKNPWVVDDKLIIDDSMITFMDNVRSSLRTAMIWVLIPGLPSGVLQLKVMILSAMCFLPGVISLLLSPLP